MTSSKSSTGNGAQDKRNCQHCTQPLPEGSSPKRQYCSQHCRSKARYQRRKTTQPQQLAEWAQTSRQRQRERDQQNKPWRYCPTCDSHYKATHERKHCPNRACMRRRRTDQTGWHTGAQRARKHGGRIEPFTYLQVFQRDNFTCHLCGGTVAYGTGRHRDPYSASLDHIVPLEQGGDHTLDNVACAHFRCNNKKAGRSADAARRTLRNNPINPSTGKEKADVIDLAAYAIRLARSLTTPRQ